MKNPEIAINKPKTHLNTELKNSANLLNLTSTKKQDNRLKTQVSVINGKHKYKVIFTSIRYLNLNFFMGGYHYGEYND